MASQLPGNSAAQLGRLNSVTNAGQIAGSANFGDGYAHAAIFAGGAFTDLGAFSGNITVVAITDDEGMVAGAQMLSVELLVQRERIARILQATASGDLLSLGPAAVPLGR